MGICWWGESPSQRFEMDQSTQDISIAAQNLLPIKKAARPINLVKRGGIMQQLKKGNKYPDPVIDESRPWRIREREPHASSELIQRYSVY